MEYCNYRRPEGSSGVRRVDPWILAGNAAPVGRCLTPSLILVFDTCVDEIAKKSTLDAVIRFCGIINGPVRHATASASGRDFCCRVNRRLCC